MHAFFKKLPTDAVYTKIKSPVGELVAIGSSAGLHALLFEGEYDELSMLRESPDLPLFSKVKTQLKEYFSGKRASFEIPLVVEGTEFQKKAWSELRRIPYGKTISYSQQARRLGDDKKARAVGTANSKNPLAIIVPCHRVIAAGGSLSGFGGGVHNKKYLLELEEKFASH